MIKQPYLVQRGSVIGTTGTISQCVKLDYMGSSEFEWGATARSLREMHAQAANLRLRVSPFACAKSAVDIRDKGRALRVFSALTDEEFQQYAHYLMRMRGDDATLRLKERSGFAPSKLYSDKTDFWWDIDNHVMWSFHKPLMNNLLTSLQASWTKMKLPVTQGASA